MQKTILHLTILHNLEQMDFLHSPFPLLIQLKMFPIVTHNTQIINNNNSNNSNNNNDNKAV